MSGSRRATHAGSWYSGNASSLNKQIEAFFNGVDPTKVQSSIEGVRFVVGPHAGYSYAGQTLAYTYKAWDTSKVKRLFILGPTHHVAFRGAMLSGFASYETPLGSVPVDTETTKKLHESGLFKMMSQEVDEDEHSFEMHMPFIYKASMGSIPVIPIMVGSTDETYDKKLAQLLQPYLSDESSSFAVSTDFCHWGSRFDYTAYTTDPGASDIRTLRKVSKLDLQVPIYKSIEYLDKLGMTVASQGSYKKWQEYLDATDNTICGRTPLGIVILAMELCGRADTSTSFGQLTWVDYSQSSKVKDVYDSSVSYGAGYAVL